MSQSIKPWSKSEEKKKDQIVISNVLAGCQHATLSSEIRDIHLKKKKKHNSIVFRMFVVTLKVIPRY